MMNLMIDLAQIHFQSTAILLLLAQTLNLYAGEGEPQAQVNQLRASKLTYLKTLCLLQACLHPSHS